MKSKKFQENKAQSAALLAWAQQSEQATAAIAVECRIAREQQELQAAWDELQHVPSYCERDVSAEHLRMQCASCKESYAIAIRTRHLLLTYCTVECAVHDGMAQQEAEQQFEEVVYIEQQAAAFAKEQ